MALNGNFDAIVLDLMLPRRSGLDVLESVRRAMPSVPVIVLSARGEIEDRVGGLDAGAVDYLVKPFSMTELVARVRAHLRVIAQASASTLAAEDIEVDLMTRRVRRGGHQVMLSTTEFELLVYLLRHHGQVVSREQILSSVWGYEHDPATNVVDVYVGYLRRKLAISGSPRRYIRARGGLSPRQLGLRRVRSSLRRLVPTGLRWRLAGWFTLVTLLCIAIVFVAVYRGTGSQLRSQIDHELSGDAAELSHNLTQTDAEDHHERGASELHRAATRYITNQPFSASSTLLFVLIPVSLQYQQARAVRQPPSRGRGDGR